MPSVSKMMKPQVISTRMNSFHCTLVIGKRSIRAAICPWIETADARPKAAMSLPPPRALCRRFFLLELLRGCLSRLNRIGTKPIFERLRIDFFQFDFSGQDLALPFLVCRLVSVEFGHDVLREQFQALANVLVRVAAGLIGQNDLVDIGRPEP